jgi:hypothetical protein
MLSNPMAPSRKQESTVHPIQGHAQSSHAKAVNIRDGRHRSLNSQGHIEYRRQDIPLTIIICPDPS